MISILIISLTTFAMSGWQTQVSINQFFAAFEKRTRTTQQRAILDQRATRIWQSIEDNEIYFDVQNPQPSDWRTLVIPKEIISVRETEIIFAARTGNNSSLRAFEFYLPKQQKRVIYQFQMGSGQFTKRVE